MADRDRVREAIETPVDEAAKLLDEAQHADAETRLAMRIDGWGRGLAAGLEELAIAISDLRRTPPVEDTHTPSPPPEPKPDAGVQKREDGEEEMRSEDELRAEAARSREKTAELREEGARD